MYGVRRCALHDPLRAALATRLVRRHRVVGMAALLCSRRTLSSSSTAEGGSYVDWLDTMWTRLTTSSASTATTAHLGKSDVLSSLDETSLSAFDSAFVSLQGALGVEPWLLLLLFGAATRLCTLGLSLYGDRASARMQGAASELAAAQAEFDRVYRSETATALEVQLAASALKSERRRVFAAHHTSTQGCLVPLLGTPLVLYGLLQVSALCANPYVLGLMSNISGVGVAFAWCPTLGQPDPLYLLPALSCGLTLANFELSLDRTLRSAWMGNLIWAARLACLCVLPVASSFRSGVCLYFVGMSVVGLLQPLLLRSQRFRRLCDFPARVTATTDKATDALQARVRLQLPYLSHFLSPESEDAPRPLFTRATSAKPQRHTGVLGPTHYSPGDNPLMRELPLHKVATAVKSSAPQAKKSSVARGLAFASGSTSGWRSPQVSYDETDFLPDDTQHTKK